MSDLIFSFRDISIRNFNSMVFEGLNFSLEKGQHWALIGKSASGKSTFLDFIAGNASLAQGTAIYPWFDQFIKDHHQDDPLFNRLKLISHVSSRHQFRNLSNTNTFYYQQRFNSCDSDDADTVAEYLSSIKIYNPSRAWTFKRVTERLKLIPLLDKQLIKLSHGETKRLMLAAALIKNPLLLLLDNLLNGLDVGSRKDFNDLITEIAKSGISIIMATPPTEIPDAITHVAVLESGKMISQTTSSGFTPDLIYPNELKKPDKEELRILLSMQNQQIYETIIGMEDVSIKYGDKQILDRINWQMKQGERWMLTGSNGAGKSTLLSLVNGDNPQAFANKIILFDRRKGGGESIWEIKQKIGYVSPEFFQYFPMESTCLQVVESGFYDTLGLFRPSVNSKMEISLRWMNVLEIAGYSKALIRNVPVSIQRICLLARAMVKNPALLILDEPCLGLDNSQLEQFRYLIDDICLISNMSLIYVSHYQHEMPECITHSLRLENGRVVFC